MHNSVAYGALLASNIKTTAQTAAMVRVAYAISFLDMLGYGFLSPITYSLLNKDIIGATGFGALQSVSNAAALLAGASLGRLSDTRGRKPAIVVSAGLSLIGYLLYVAGRVAADAPLAACVLPCMAQVLTTVGRAGLIAPLNALMADGQSDEEGRRRVGRLVGIFGLGYAIGSGTGGYLSQYDHALLLALACLVSAAVLACSLLLPNSKPSSKPSSTPPALVANGRAHAVSGDSDSGSGSAGSGGGGWLRATRTALSDRATVLLLVLQLLRNVSFHVYSGTSKIYLCEHLGYSQAQLSYTPLPCYPLTRRSSATSYLLLATYYLLLTTHRSPLATRHSPLTTHRSPLTVHRSPFTTHHSPPTGAARLRALLRWLVLRPEHAPRRAALPPARRPRAAARARLPPHGIRPLRPRRCLGLVADAHHPRQLRLPQLGPGYDHHTAQVTHRRRRRPAAARPAARAARRRRPGRRYTRPARLGRALQPRRGRLARVGLRTGRALVLVRRRAVRGRPARRLVAI